MLDQVVTEFATRATSWQTVVMNAAMFLFWTLGTISLVFTFGFMALRKADNGEFFAEFVNFTASELAKGVGSQMKQGFQERVTETTGGKISSAT